MRNRTPFLALLQALASLALALAITLLPSGASHAAPAAGMGKSAPCVENIPKGQPFAGEMGISRLAAPNDMAAHALGGHTIGSAERVAAQAGGGETCPDHRADHSADHGRASCATHGSQEGGDTCCQGICISAVLTEQAEPALKPSEFAFETGDTIRFEILNGELEHEFVLDTPAGNRVHKDAMAQTDMTHDDPNALRLVARGAGRGDLDLHPRGQVRIRLPDLGPL